MAMCGCTGQVRLCRLGLLLTRLNGSPVCDDSAAEGGMCKCGAVQVNLTQLRSYMKSKCRCSVTW